MSKLLNEIAEFAFIKTLFHCLLFVYLFAKLPRPKDIEVILLHFNQANTCLVSRHKLDAFR